MHPGNPNANPSIVWSVVLYVLRLLCKKDINLNEGLTRNVKLLLPTGFYPHFSKRSAKCPAVVGGNTEELQRLTDTLIKALKLAACSQGTMNNFIW
ncbi:MAG: hydantoinase B/oxoprolinase family protein [Saprospiraceae bacterium]|nr:hydantoinase B/oxoprolinase family protein [Saprospiraceae bacterium]